MSMCAKKKKKSLILWAYSSKSDGNVTTLPTHTSYNHCHDIYQELMSGEAANKFLIYTKVKVSRSPDHWKQVEDGKTKFTNG